MKRAMTWCFASCLVLASVAGCKDDDDSNPTIAGEDGGAAGAVETGGTAGETGEDTGGARTGGTGGTGGTTGGTAGEPPVETGGTAGEPPVETGGTAGEPPVETGGTAGAPVVVGGAAGAPVVVGGAAGAPVAEGGAGGAGPSALLIDCVAKCAVIQSVDCPDEGSGQDCYTACVAAGGGPCAAEYAAEVACLAGTEAADWACDETEGFETAYSVDVCTAEIDATFDCLAG